MQALKIGIGAFFIIAATALHAAVVPVSLSLKPRADVLKGKEATVRLRPVDTVASMQSGSADIVKMAVIGDPLPLELATGYWAVTVSAPGVWPNTQFITISQNAAPIVDVWPSAQLAGSVHFDEGATAKELHVFLSRVGDSNAPQQAEAVCPIDSGRFRCEIPAGTFDVRTHAATFISRFFRNVLVAPATTRDLGAISLKAGQAILGRVELPRGMKKGEIGRTVVLATPVAVGNSQNPLFAGANLIPLKGAIDSEGRFQIEGLPPGPYFVSASHPLGLYSDASRVMIRSGAEVQLVQPLRLDRARRLSVTIDPPVAYSGKPWHVRLNHDLNERRTETITESDATAGGAWEATSLHPGTYTVRVGTTEGGSTWYTETFDISTDASKVVHIPAVRVHGRVTIGGKPLQALLTFSDNAGRAIAAPADGEGLFKCLLPDRGDEAKWAVFVKADSPTVARTIRDLAIKTDGAAETTLDIDVPSSLIMGTVVDADGTPIPKAIVNVSKADGGEPLMQSRTAQDGSFAIHGIADGAYSVSASAFMKESEPFHFEMREDAQPEPMRLVVKAVKKITGVVVSDLGPVAGARVLLLPTDADYMFQPTRMTDVQGIFEAWIPSNCMEFDLFVAPPGFTYTIDHLPYQEGRSLSVRVYQRGGSLEMHDADGLVLVHGGGMTDANSLVQQWSAHQGNEGKVVVADMMEPGPYSLCKVMQSDLFRRSNGAQGGNCVGGFLPPSGNLTLKLP